MEIPALPAPLTPAIVAAHLAGVPVTDVLAVAIKSDGTLVVVVNPGPKYTYLVNQVAEAVAFLLQAGAATVDRIGDFLQAVGSEQTPADPAGQISSPAPAVLDADPAPGLSPDNADALLHALRAATPEPPADAPPAKRRRTAR